ADGFEALHLLQGRFDPFTLLDLCPQLAVGFGQLVDGGDLVGDVAGRRVDAAIFGHGGPGQPAIAVVAMAHPVDEAIGDLAFGNADVFRHRVLQVVRVHQLTQGLLHQLAEAPAENVLPDGV